MEKKLKMIIGALAAVILVLAGILVWQMSKKTEIKEEVQVLSVDKENLSDQLAQLQQDYASLSSSNDTINTQLQIERQKVAELIEKVKKTEASNASQLRKYEKELGTLRAIMRGYIKQIDSLNQMNIALKEEVTEAKKLVQETEAKNEAQAKKIEEQSKKISEGSTLKSRGLRIAALNRRGKAMERSSRTEQFMVSLSLVENSIAETGPVTVYIRIKDPDGVLMTDGGQQVFTCAGEQLIYSASREVDYQGQELDLNIFFTPGGELQKGTYTAEAYTSKAKLGTAEVRLK